MLHVSFPASLFTAALSFLTASSNVCADPLPSGDGMIRAPFGSSEIVITTTARLAGAIHSVTWAGREFIDSADHGRQLQSASAFDMNADGNGETFNPTEAGSRDDGAGPRSASRLLRMEAAGTKLRTLSQMAFWLAPGERSGGKLARNTAPLSNHQLEKEVKIGVPGLPNVIDYAVTFTLPADEPHYSAQFEALTGYMPADFERFWRLNPATSRLEPLPGGPPAEPGPAEQRDPVALSTADGSHAMGIVAPEPVPPGTIGPSYGRFRFIPERVTKWNCVFRVKRTEGITPGEYRFHMFVAIGTLADVESALAALARKPAPASASPTAIPSLPCLWFEPRGSHLRFLPRGFASLAPVPFR